MRKVDLRMNELQKYEVIKKVAYGGINKNRAAVSMELLQELLVDYSLNIIHMVRKVLFLLKLISLLKNHKIKGTIFLIGQKLWW